MKRYERYTPNESTLIPMLPEGWRYLPLKYIARFYTGNSLNEKEKEQFLETVEDSLPYIATKDISSVNKSADYANGISIPKVETSYKVAPKDSFLICIEGGSAGRKMTYLTQDVCFVNKLCCIDANEGKKFLFYVFQSAPFQSEFQQSLQGLIGGVSISRLADMRFAIPSQNEQRKIAAFLDYKTGKIDRLTEMLTARIDDLKKYRQSVITEAVTKGLDKAAKLKDSGVDWIGCMPITWNVCKLKFVVKLQSGTNLTSEQISDKGLYPVYGGNGIRGYYENYKLDGDYVLIGRQGALCGNINYASGKFWPTEHAIVCYPYNMCPTRWLGELLRSMNLNQYSESAAQPGLAVEKISNLQIPVPPIQEQQAIADYLDCKTKQIDDTIAATEQQIKDLQAYRTSLISEVVTGQIDVRDWVAPKE